MVFTVLATVSQSPMIVKGVPKKKGVFSSFAVMAHENGMRTDFDSVRRRYYHNSGTDLLALLVHRASEVLRLRFEECEINEGSGARLEERFNRFRSEERRVGKGGRAW